MASSKQLLLLAVVAAVACLASVASATQWIVGDEVGWRTKFNQTGWVDGKTFRVGDSLVFKYPKQNHTVVQVGEDDFAACNVDGEWFWFWDSGNDVVPLDKPGMLWFICPMKNHCRNGMKLAIDVVDSTVVSPSPSPSPSPSRRPSTPATPPPPFGQPSTPAPPPPVRSTPLPPRSAAERNKVGSAVAAAVAAVVAAALAF